MLTSPTSRLMRCLLAFGLLLPLLAIADISPVAAQTTMTTVSVDPGQNPSDTSPSPVWAILEGNGRYYIGGEFTTVDGRTQAYLAAVTASSGRIDRSFAPVISGGTTEVKAMALSPDGSDLYVAGVFQTVDGVSRNRIAKFDAITGDLDMNFNPGASAVVETIAVDASGVYVGGKFDTIAGVNSPHLAKLHPVTGAVDPSWNATVNGSVLDIELFNDNVYVAGNFGQVNGEVAGNLVRLQASNGVIHRDWNPTYEFPDRVLVISLSDNGRTVFAGTAGTLRNDGNGNSVWSLTSGGARNWQRPLGGDVQALEAFGDSIFVGTHGQVVFKEAKFELDGVTPRAAFPNDGYVENASTNPNAVGREKLFSLDQQTGEILAFDPSMNSVNGVWELESGPTGLLVGGDFTQVLNPNGVTGTQTTIDANHVAIFSNPFVSGDADDPTPPGPTGPFSCAVTTSGANATITYSGDHGTSTQLLRDGTWNRTITNQTSTLVTGGAGSNYSVRARGDQFSNPFEDIACTTDGGGTPDPDPDPDPETPGVFTCAVTTAGSNATITTTGDQGSSTQLLRNGSWIQTITGQTSISVAGGAGSAYAVRIRGAQYADPFEDITCSGGGQAPQDPSALTCAVTTNGDNATITITGDQGTDTQLRRDGKWFKSIDGAGSVTVSGGAGSAYAVRVRGPQYADPFEDITCSGGGQGTSALTCTVSTAGGNATITTTGDHGTSAQLRRDNSWFQTIDGAGSITVSGGANSNFTVRVRGPQYAQPFEDITCA